MIDYPSHQKLFLIFSFKTKLNNCSLKLDDKTYSDKVLDKSFKVFPERTSGKYQINFGAIRSPIKP